MKNALISTYHWIVSECWSQGTVLGDQMVSWWRHQMETFSALLAICAGNSPVPGEFPHKGQWGGALMFSLICVWTNGWVNNRKAGDLRRYRIHYDVIVMYYTIYRLFFSKGVSAYWKKYIVMQSPVALLPTTYRISVQWHLQNGSFAQTTI